MRRFVCFLLISVFIVLITSAYGDEEFNKLRSDYIRLIEEWYAQMTKAESGTISDTPDIPKHPMEAFVPRIKAYAQKHAGKTEAIPALMWLVSEGIVSEPTKAGKAASGWALKVLTNQHAADPVLGTEIPNLILQGIRGTYVSNKALKVFYERLLEKNSDNQTLSWAAFGLGFDIYHDKADSEENAQSNQKQALNFFRRAAKEYKGTQAAEWAACYVYEIENLQLGMKAPEIVGTDVDGKEIRLSQFLGRVVVINFWGFW